MPVMPDHWIRKMAQKSGMIAPFEEKMQRQGVISYGLSSYGYDARLADDFKIFTNVDNAIVDPKNFSENSFVTRKTDVCIIPPNSFVLSHTVEYFKIPRDVLVICLGKSTYARCGLIVNVTPLEPEWEGHVTLEVSNTTPLPAKVYANEGICQFLFLKADSECEVSYADRGGKYQGQTGVTLPRMEAEVKESGGLMDRIRIQGGKSLKGKIHISGAKNSALKLMAASLLTEETVTLNNMPHLADITSMANLLEQHGVQLGVSGTHDGAKGRVMELKAANITSFTAPYDLVRKMRASIQVLGPLLARFGQAKVSLPGGCVIGSRPVDLHIMALERLGAEITLEGGYVSARAPKGLKGAEIVFPKVTMGGTETAMMAAALAKGETVIINAAREPEVGDLASCLVAMGAEIEGVGSDRLRIVGKDRLHGTRHDIIPDRLETGTFAMAAAITQGDIELVGARLENIRAAAVLMEQAGVTIEETPEGLRVYRKDGLRGVDMMTEPYPGFPTDLQAQLMALMCVAEGASMITETIFENRFMHVPELSRMGANITVHNASAMIRGVKKLTGAPVMATDIRASVSLVLAGLVAEGETTISRVYHLDRGYERLEEKLGACGANIERISDRDEEEVPHGRVAA